VFPIDVSLVDDAESGLKLLKEGPLDCVIWGPEQAARAEELLIETQDGDPVVTRTPAVIYEGDAALESTPAWRKLSEHFVVRRVHSPERLLDQVMFFLHRNVATLAGESRQRLLDLHQSDKLLVGKKVLIVDDDMRNIFALSTVLEEHDMAISSADNGRTAISILQKEPDFDIVLMDIMMPDMDGYETIGKIRENPAFSALPILALTAKAMKGDREKCLNAGASDYIAKPVNTDQLLSLMRVWLFR
jgi:CheY-like chemotaxis protein